MADALQLVIVRRDQFPKFALLAQAFADEPNVRLIWDRRLRQQRRECASSNPEDRRRRDRRGDPSESWGHHDHLLLGVATPGEAVDDRPRIKKRAALGAADARGTVEGCLASAGLPQTNVECRRGAVIFSPGDDADSVMYVLKGIVKLSVSGRREAVVGVLGPGDFFGEECLAGHSTRQRTATAMAQSTVLVIGRSAMERLLRTEPALAQRFITYLLSRTVRIEDDLMDQLLSSCEQRLARRLLLLAGYGHRGTRKKIVPRTSQLTLAGIVGSTRPRINYFLQKFKTQGFVDMDGSLTVHRSLLSVVSPFLRGSLRNSSSQLAGDRVMRRMAGRRVVKAAVSDSSRSVKKKD